MEAIHRGLRPENVSYTAFLPDRLLLDEAEGKITSMAACANLLFVGTSNGMISEFMFEECELEETCFKCVKLLSRTLSDQAILKMELCLDINLLLCISKGDLLMCNAEQLELSPRTITCRNVTAYQLIPEEQQHRAKLYISFASSILHVYLLSSTGSQFLLEFKLTYAPEHMAVGEKSVCFAAAGKYFSLDQKTKTSTEFFQYDRNTVKPFVVHVTQDEFLIAGPSSLGVVVDPHGTSGRPPLQLSSNVLRVFVWENYAFSITDEFLTIHNVNNQMQLQTVALKQATAACFSPRNPHLFFVALEDAEQGPCIVTVGPERWDRFARKLLVAGCVGHAINVIQSEHQRLNTLIEESSPFAASGERLFSRRSKRVLNLLGFYFFEQADFDKAKFYFMKGLVDARELLVRYDDLLPDGYHFVPNWFFSLKMESDSVANPLRVSELCIQHSETPPEGETSGQSVTAWLVQYDKFLFKFLQLVQRANLRLEYAHLIETALVKLYIRLSHLGVKPTVLGTFWSHRDFRMLPLAQSDVPTDGLMDLVSSMAVLDLDDLVTYLQRSQSFHALALVLQWRGSVGEAVDIWRDLAYGNLSDSLFPGLDFYVSILKDLASPSSDTGRDGACAPGEDAEPPVYSELIWKHFCYAVDGSHLKVVEKLLFAIPYTGDTCSELPDTVFHCEPSDTSASLAPSQCLTLSNLLRKIIPAFPALARRYLRHVIYNYHASAPALHNLLVRMYVDQLLSQLEGSQSHDDLKKLRREFCHFLRYSEFYSTALALSICADKVDLLPFECAILYGKAGRHETALDLLINQLNDLPAALCYCCSYLTQTSSPDGDQQTQSGFNAVASDVFTILVELCLKKALDSVCFHMALNLINSPDIPICFRRVLSALPNDIPICQLKGFFSRSLRSLWHQSSSLLIEYSLATKCASLTSQKLTSQHSPIVGLKLNADTKCAICEQDITKYGQIGHFVQLGREQRFAHKHCGVAVAPLNKK